MKGEGLRERSPISTGATQHLVNADDMEGVDANAKVERILARVLSHVFVSANTGRFQSLRRDLFVLVRDEVSAEREVIDAGTLATQVKNADLSRDQSATDVVSSCHTVNIPWRLVHHGCTCS